METSGVMLSMPQIADEIKGRLIAPDDPGYDRARTVFAATVDRRPALIVRAADAADVARVVAIAHETGMELAVRSGGHSPAGHGVSEGGIVLDLRDMQGLEIDVERRTARADAGMTAGQYSIAADEHGLATGFGDMGTVGISGITLSGGVGYLSRKHGLTVDNLLAADVVTADGELVRTSPEEHPDLFWAIRGGGGNFGVATRLEFRLQPVDGFVGGMLVLPATASVIASFVSEAEAAPDELSTIANVMTAPPLPFLPPELHGRLILMALLGYVGPAEDAERTIARFRALATPLADMVGPMPYPQIFPPEDESYRPVAESRTMFVDDFDERTADMVLDRLRASNASMAAAQLRVLGGAIARVPADATAYAHRERRIMVNVAAIYERREEQPEHAAWVDGLATALNRGDAAGYTGFLRDEGQERVRAAYPGATWDRLAAIKARYDPDNVFRLNQNIPPAPGQ
jgi:FAD/FMN-containing dehydrogenase